MCSMPSASMLLLTILIIFFRAFLTSFITYKELGETDHVASVGKKSYSANGSRAQMS